MPFPMDVLQTSYASSSAESTADDEDDDAKEENEAPIELSTREIDAKRREIARKFALRSAQYVARHQTLHNKPSKPQHREADEAVACIQRHGLAASPDFQSQYHKITSCERLKRPMRVVWCWHGHDKQVNCVQWQAKGLLALSASMDHTIRVWKHQDHESSQDQPSRSESSSGTSPSLSNCLRVHGDYGVADAKWSLDSCRIVSGGFDQRVVCSDIERSAALQSLATNDFVSCVAVHPRDAQLVVFGTHTKGICCWDLRQNAVVRHYKRQFDQVQDLCFLPVHGDASEDSNVRFVSSSCIRRQSASNQTLLVWDFASGALLADQMDREMFAFPCVKVHPSGRFFLAQSSAGYAHCFDCCSYKLMKRKTFTSPVEAPTKRLRRGFLQQSHEIDAYRISGSFNCSGHLFASGDATGRVVVYDGLAPSHLLSSTQVFSCSSACTSAEFHPSLDTTLLACSSSGQLALLR